MPFDTQIKLPFQRSGEGDGPLFAEFFAGIGLMRLGLEAAGWRIGWANDIDSMKYRLYDAHFGDAAEHFELEDVHKVEADSLPAVELATASFPCTDLSLAGGRKGINAGESSAFWGFRDVVAGMEHRPRYILLENVPGFLTSHGGQDFEQAMLALNELGYTVDPFFVDAKWFVPQSRLRLFVVGELEGEESLGDMKPTRTRPEAIQRFIRDHQDIAWGVRTLPDPPERSGHLLNNIVEKLKRGDNRWWSDDRVDYLVNQMSDKHYASLEPLIDKAKWSYGTVFRRVRKQGDGSKRSMAELRLDGIAGCLRTPKGGSGRQILVQAGYGQVRARLLTPRECARLMGADEFQLSGTDNEALFGFGDAVCAKAVSWIALNRLMLTTSQENNDSDRSVHKLVS
ncbi:MAG: DNA cytosine methyltransferase [Phycisphaerales bacterium]